MRDVPEQPPLRLDEGLDPSRHVVEVTAQVRDLVPPLSEEGSHARLQCPSGKLPGRLLQVQDRRSQGAGEEIADDAGDNEGDGQTEAEVAGIKHIFQRRGAGHLGEYDVVVLQRQGEPQSPPAGGDLEFSGHGRRGSELFAPAGSRTARE